MQEQKGRKRIEWETENEPWSVSTERLNKHGVGENENSHRELKINPTNISR